MKVKAYELRTKNKGELLKQLEELKNELAQVSRPLVAESTPRAYVSVIWVGAAHPATQSLIRSKGMFLFRFKVVKTQSVAPCAAACREGDWWRCLEARQDWRRPQIDRASPVSRSGRDWRVVLWHIIGSRPHRLQPDAKVEAP